jgi:hypothetical protein
MKLVLTGSGFLLILCGLCAGAHAAIRDSTRTGRWYLPHHIPMQFAGNIGFFATGIGYATTLENYQLSLLYGYVPASIAGTPVHTITGKNVFPLSRYLWRNNNTFVPYLGLGLSLEVGGISFFRLPSHYPESYYDFPKNLHVTAFAGVKLRHLFQDDEFFFRGIEFYGEAGTVDVYLWYKVISEHIRFNKIFSVALGVNLLLDP